MRPGAVIVLLLTAGCVGPSAFPGAAPPDSALPEPPFSFAPPTIVGAGAAEASLAFAPDGTMLACTHGGFTAPSPVYASDDDGATWRRSDPTPNPIVSGDCDVSIGPDGAWYVAFDTLASATVAVSNDRGASWRTSFAAALPVGGVDRPWLQATPAGIHMTYCDVMGAEPAACFFATSKDGTTWLDHRALVVPDGEDRPHAVVGRLWTSPDGADIRVPVYLFNGFVADPDGWFASYESKDAGATWRAVPVAGPFKTPPQFPSISVDEEGTAWFSFTIMNGTTAPVGAMANVGWPFPVVTDVMVASQPRDGSWSAPMLVAPAQAFNTVASTWTSGGRTGAVVAWEAAASETSWHVQAARVANGAQPILADVSGETPAFAGVDFLQVWHEDGRALVFYVMDGGSCGARSPQCIYLARETVS